LPVASPTSDAALPRASTRSRNALLLGNFAIGCGVMVVPAALNDLVVDLGVSVALGGQLIAAGAAILCLGAPLLAALLSHFDRRRLLTLSLIWYVVGHALGALAPGYVSLLALRCVGVLAAAVFTPQAAATMGVMNAPHERGRAITFIFLGWSLASVLGMPVLSYVAQTAGWRWAFGLVAALSALAAVAVWRSLPAGVHPPRVSLASWRQVYTQPALLAIVGVTALASAGQFTLFSYLTPYCRQVLDANASSISLLFLWYGAIALGANMLLSRHVDRVGAARAVDGLLASMTLAMLLFAWPAGALGMAVVLVPWAFGGFASNSAQQARLGHAAPALAGALLALNTSAIYLGQAVGAGSGALVVAAGGFGPLHLMASTWMLLALALSRWASASLARSPLASGQA
jgi:predicted MFS family arabinose efflux permease